MKIYAVCMSYKLSNTSRGFVKADLYWLQICVDIPDFIVCKTVDWFVSTNSIYREESGLCLSGMELSVQQPENQPDADVVIKFNRRKGHSM